MGDRCLSAAHPRPLLRDKAGSSVVEFALIAPVLIMLVFGSLEFGLNVYMRAVAEGALIEAGRASSLQTAQSGQTAIDQNVRASILNIMPSATVSFQRDNYASFSKVNQPEDFTDTNGNGRHDATECFQDSNGNGQWDADSGRTGLGGANDVVEYTVTISYPSWIPGASALKLSPTTQIKAKTLLRNQPFATQPGWSVRQVCP